MARAAPEMVIVSNRLPVNRVSRARGSGWERSPGGLVSALIPVLQNQNGQEPGRSTHGGVSGSYRNAAGVSGSWIGWLGSSGPVPKSFRFDGILNLPVPLSAAEVKDFYEGFCNRTLWPLYHDAVRQPEYNRSWWRPYLDANERFARAAVRALKSDGLAWVHDYHLQLVPALIRRQRPDARIGFFLHIPFPPQELFLHLPWRYQILEGLLGADVVGFQTADAAHNFRELARRFAGATGKRDELRVGGREVVARAFPISIDFARYEELAASDAVRRRARDLVQRVGRGRRILLGIDRLDYTKGIDLRLLALREAFRRGSLDPRDVVLLQVAVPSRERVTEYREQRELVERLVGEINGEFGELTHSPVKYLHKNLGTEDLVAVYLAADVLLVTPLRDGMNLVAKEYVASRADERGVLVLSEFAGAAHELDSAVLVNPHDVDTLADRIAGAVHMSATEQALRMRAMRRVVRRHDVFRWADGFIEALRG